MTTGLRRPSAPSKISGHQFVGSPAPALIDLGGGSVNQGAMGIESAQERCFIGQHVRLNGLERFLIHRKSGLHRAIVAPELHGAQCCVVGAALVGKIKRHEPGAVPRPPCLTLRVPGFS